MKITYHVEIDLGGLGTGPRYLAALKNKDGTWTLTLNADQLDDQQLHELITSQLTYATVQMAGKVIEERKKARAS